MMYSRWCHFVFPVNHLKQFLPDLWDITSYLHDVLCILLFLHKTYSFRWFQEYFRKAVKDLFLYVHLPFFICFVFHSSCLFCVASCVNHSVGAAETINSNGWFSHWNVSVIKEQVVCENCVSCTSDDFESLLFCGFKNKMFPIICSYNYLSTHQTEQKKQMFFMIFVIYVFDMHWSDMKHVRG